MLWMKRVQWEFREKPLIKLYRYKEVVLSENDIQS